MITATVLAIVGLNAISAAAATPALLLHLYAWELRRRTKMSNVSAETTIRARPTAASRRKRPPRATGQRAPVRQAAATKAASTG